MESPYFTSNASIVAWSDHFKGYDDVVTRETAVQIPPVAKAEKVLKTLADVPLVAYRGIDPVATQPAWLQRTDGAVSPWHRMAYTITDLFYDGWSVWYVERGAAGQIMRAAHVPKSRIEVVDGGLKIDGEPMKREDVIFFAGPDRGLLFEAADTIRGARAITKAWVGRTQTPIPLTVIKEALENHGLTKDEIKTVIDDWVAARQSPTGATGFLPYGLELETHTGVDDALLFTEGRNNIRLDIANFANIPAAMLDGSTATASLTYVTQEGQRSTFNEQSVRYWLAPIEHRLSLDDCVPAGQRVRFDIAYLNNSPQEVTSD
ncbi:phage portal protein [Microbacterium sp. Ag1]|uniref:phage portal protein n=1 Tax=Microbacterium sp. Ag1 TaxID=1643443 RepID=UPI0018CE47EC|nr:phage portal protein [Microbacterium sp. Ag1]